MPAEASRAFRPGRALVRWLRAWWQIVHLGALIGALACSPSSYARARWPLMASHLARAAVPALVSFGLVSALLSLVIARIVLVTAQSYGLTQFALGMVVRVLVLELIPLGAALFVAVRISVPDAAGLARARRRGELARMRDQGVDPLRDVLAPRALAAFFSVWLLALLAGVIALGLAYLLVHGFNPFGVERFSRQVGQVFTPAVTLIFLLKTLAFGAAVAVVPMGSALHDAGPPASPLPLELQGLVRLLLAVLLIETASLAGNYY